MPAPLTGIVLATYNEAQSLPSLLERLQGLEVPLRIYVVDDASPDGTALVARRLGDLYHNITVLERPGKSGLGSALRDGMLAALKDNCSYIVTMDADLSHDPASIPTLLPPLISGYAAMVQGSRYVTGGSTKGYHWRRRALSRLANTLYHHILGTPTEATTSFRAFARPAAELVVSRCHCRGFAFQPEVALMLMRHGLKIQEVPISFTHRTRGKSKLDLLQAIQGGLFFSWALLAYRGGLGRFRHRSKGHPRWRSSPPVG